MTICASIAVFLKLVLGGIIEDNISQQAYIPVKQVLVSRSQYFYSSYVVQTQTGLFVLQTEVKSNIKFLLVFNGKPTL